jgi:predicted ABC-type ATPase
VILFFLKLPSKEMAIQRVKLRVSEGGHNIPTETIKRRFVKGWNNFNNVYKDLVDAWVVFDNSTEQPLIIEQSK